MYLYSLIAQFEFNTPLSGPGGYDPGTSIDSATTSITNLLSNVVGLLTIVAGIAFLIYFTIGGITWITSGGDKGKTEEAKNRMTGGAIGMIIVVAAWAISWIIGQVLGIDFLNPAETIKNLGPGNTPQSTTAPYQPQLPPPQGGNMPENIDML